MIREILAVEVYNETSICSRAVSCIKPHQPFFTDAPFCQALMVTYSRRPQTVMNAWIINDVKDLTFSSSFLFVPTAENGLRSAAPNCKLQKVNFQSIRRPRNWRFILGRRKTQVRWVRCMESHCIYHHEKALSTLANWISPVCDAGRTNTQSTHSSQDPKITESESGDEEDRL